MAPFAISVQYYAICRLVIVMSPACQVWIPKPGEVIYSICKNFVYIVKSWNKSWSWSREWLHLPFLYYVCLVQSLIPRFPVLLNLTRIHPCFPPFLLLAFSTLFPCIHQLLTLSPISLPPPPPSFYPPSLYPPSLHPPSIHLSVFVFAYLTPVIILDFLI